MSANLYARRLRARRRFTKSLADIIEAEGVDTNEVLDKVLRDVLEADLIVGHNV